jgi:hypothetical protein
VAVKPEILIRSAGRIFVETFADRRTWNQVDRSCSSRKIKIEHLKEVRMSGKNVPPLETFGIGPEVRES